MTLSADELIRRFLLHVLPDGFQRIRYYGFLCNRYRQRRLTLCRELLGMPELQPATGEPYDDYRERYGVVAGTSLKECPVYDGHMIFFELIPKPDGRSRQDTSRYRSSAATVPTLPRQTE